MNTLSLVKEKHFANGSVYCLRTQSGHLVEVTDTFLPYYTKDAANQGDNFLKDYYLGSRQERWMIGVSCMSGCPVRCKFCATGQMKKFYNLTTEEIVRQVLFVLDKNTYDTTKCKEFKINYTRMGEPFLNIEAVRATIAGVNLLNPNTHHYISTIGVKGSDFSWIKGNVTLQISLHSLDEDRRNWLIPFKNKMTIEELGQIRTHSNLKTTVNLTLVDEKDFDIEKLKKYFDPKYFFIKMSPINNNCVALGNEINNGVINQLNLA